MHNIRQINVFLMIFLGSERINKAYIYIYVVITTIPNVYPAYVFFASTSPCETLSVTGQCQTKLVCDW